MWLCVRHERQQFALHTEIVFSFTLSFRCSRQKLFPRKQQLLQQLLVSLPVRIYLRLITRRITYTHPIHTHTHTQFLIHFLQLFKSLKTFVCWIVWVINYIRNSLFQWKCFFFCCVLFILRTSTLSRVGMSLQFAPSCRHLPGCMFFFPTKKPSHSFGFASPKGLNDSAQRSEPAATSTLEVSSCTTYTRLSPPIDMLT